MQTRLEDHNQKGLKPAIDSFEKAFLQLMQSLNSLFKMVDGDKNVKPEQENTSKDVDIAAVKEILAKLDTLLKSNNLKATAVVSSLKDMAGGGALAQQVEKLSSLINQFNFEDARNVLGEIAASVEPDE